ncbi:protein of unknown function [Burkholderia multivorans]
MQTRSAPRASTSSSLDPAAAPLLVSAWAVPHSSAAATIVVHRFIGSPPSSPLVCVSDHSGAIARVTWPPRGAAPVR